MPPAERRCTIYNTTQARAGEGQEGIAPWVDRVLRVGVLLRRGHKIVGEAGIWLDAGEMFKIIEAGFQHGGMPAASLTPQRGQRAGYE